ncbi:MAG: YqaJ viral recombinase family protein [Alphaproteobacteria bacterium]
MQIHELTQGSPEWHAFRREHFNASDAPAMMGVSPYKTRTELLDEYKSGITKEFDAATQKRLDLGHAFEALARPIAEAEYGEEFFPVVGLR